MSIFGGLFGTDDNNNNSKSKNNNKNNNNMSSSTENSSDQENGRLVLHKEELDINKNKINTGEVILNKEVVEEQQSVDVPVTHEEVVIERKSLNNQTCDSSEASWGSNSGSSSNNSGSSSNSDSSSEQIGCGETIRIPVSEEQVQVGKHTVATSEVTAYKRSIEETQHIDETLRREEAIIDKTGNAAITSTGDTTSTSGTSSTGTSGSTSDTNSGSTENSSSSSTSNDDDELTQW